MRWLALLLGLLATPAMAQQNVLLFQPPLRPVLDLDFTRMSTLDPRFTVTRAGSETGWSCDNPSKLVTFASNVAALGVCDPTTGAALGLQLWAQTTVQNQYTRDLSQAVWVKTNATAALTATGIDGAANSASLLTATGANATIVQALGATKAGVSWIFTAYVKRITGTGSIFMTLDGGLNWQDITAEINSSGYVRVPPGRGIAQSVPVATIGFKIATNTDAIAVDYAQAENNSAEQWYGPSPPVLVTNTVPLIAPIDNLSMSLSSIPGMDVNNFTVVYQMMVPQWFGSFPTQGGSNQLLSIDDGSLVSNGIGLGTQAANSVDLNNNDYPLFPTAQGVGPVGQTKVRCSTGGAGNQLNTLIAVEPGASATIAAAIGLTTGTDIACNNGGGSGTTIDTIGVPMSPVFSAQFTRLLLGQYNNGGSPGCACFLQRLQIYRGRFVGAQLQALLGRNAAGSNHLAPTFIKLEGGGNLLYESGGQVECDHC